MSVTTLMNIKKDGCVASFSFSETCIFSILVVYGETLACEDTAHCTTPVEARQSRCRNNLWSRLNVWTAAAFIIKGGLRELSTSR